MSNRVVSKNLFYFKPAGKYDDDVKELEDHYSNLPETKQFVSQLKELEVKNDPQSNEDFVFLIRRAARSFIATFSLSDELEYGSQETITKHKKVITRHDGRFDVPVDIYIPKTLRGMKNRPAYIYAHEGGPLALSVNDSRRLARCVAVDLNMVVFNVNYRAGPETKCPSCAEDFYSVIKYVSNNAESLKIDPGRIVIGGRSGGGYLCLCVMILLAERGECELVKLAVLTVPTVDDYCFSDPLVMTKEERKVHTSMRKIWRDVIPTDFQLEKRSPHLFPGKASDELLMKFPPTVIIEVEFDMFITELTRFASRLRRAGRLLEFVVVPGATHLSCFVPGTGAYQTLKNVVKFIAEEYVHT